LNKFDTSKNFCRGDPRRLAPTPEVRANRISVLSDLTLLCREPTEIYAREGGSDVHRNDKSYAILALKLLSQAMKKYLPLYAIVDYVVANLKWLFFFFSFFFLGKIVPVADRAK
jgi:hypothetical protein